MLGRDSLVTREEPVMKSSLSLKNYPEIDPIVLSEQDCFPASPQALDWKCSQLPALPRSMYTNFLTESSLD